MTAYVVVWGSACLVACLLLIARGHRFGLLAAAYWQSLVVPWKIATFVVAATGIIGIAPYTGDPTWDYIDASFMAVLAFTTAPWVVGSFYGAARRRVGSAHLFVAVCVWLFSASWSYDLYLLYRDGYYPVTWWANLIASSVLYLAAGLFWSLGWAPARGWVFSFTDEAWPRTSPGSTAGFRHVLWPALCFMLLVTVMVLLFASGWR